MSEHFQLLPLYDVEDRIEELVDCALAEGETRCVVLTNDIDADMFVTDELNSIKESVRKMVIFPELNVPISSNRRGQVAAQFAAINEEAARAINQATAVGRR